MSRTLLRTLGAPTASFRLAQTSYLPLRSSLSTLSSNPHIKVFKDHPVPGTNTLSYLPTNPPTPSLSIGTTTTLPPTPRTFQQNPHFLPLLNEVLTLHAHNDPDLLSQARAFAGPGGATFGLGAGIFQQQQHKTKRTSSKLSSGGAAGGASAQGGAGGAGRGGHVHLSDTRNPPDFGRIAWPEDILGSVEVDAEGNIVGTLEPSGTYRLLTNEGILGLTPYLREKLVERLREEEAKLLTA